MGVSRQSATGRVCLVAHDQGVSGRPRLGITNDTLATRSCESSRDRGESETWMTAQHGAWLCRL